MPLAADLSKLVQSNAFQNLQASMPFLIDDIARINIKGPGGKNETLDLNPCNPSAAITEISQLMHSTKRVTHPDYKDVPDYGISRSLLDQIKMMQSILEKEAGMALGGATLQGKGVSPEVMTRYDSVIKNLNIVVNELKNIDNKCGKDANLPQALPRSQSKSSIGSVSQKTYSSLSTVSFQHSQSTKFVEAHAKKCVDIKESIGYLREAIRGNRGKDIANIKDELCFLARALNSTESRYKGGLTAEDKKDFMAVMDKVNGLIDSGKLVVGERTEDALNTIAARATRFEITPPKQESPRDDMSNRSKHGMSMRHNG